VFVGALLLPAAPNARTKPSRPAWCLLPPCGARAPASGA